MKSPEEMRIRIAEVLGWFPCRSQYPCGGYHRYGTDEHRGDGKVVDVLPDFCNDLNAMAEAEKCDAIRAVGVIQYVACLASVVRRDAPAHVTHDELKAACIFASAAQRAEAFCRTIDGTEGLK